MARKKPSKEDHAETKFQIMYLKRGHLTPIDPSFPFHDDEAPIHPDEKVRAAYFAPPANSEKEMQLDGMDDYLHTLEVLASVVKANPTRNFCIVEVIHTCELNPWYGFVNAADLPFDTGKFEL